MAERDKSLGVMLVAILSLALGVCMVVVALIALITGSDAIKDNIQIFASLNVVVAVGISVVFAVLFFAVGFGLWYLRGWSKTILLVFSMLGVVLYPLKGLLLASSLASKESEIATSEIINVIFAVLGFVLSAFVLWYLSQPNVILTFEAREMTLTKNRIRALDEKIELGRHQCSAGEITKAELSRLRSDCIAEERLLRSKIRHLEKLRLSRERKLKDTAARKKEAREEKQAKKEEKRAEKKAKKEEKKAEKEEEKKDAEKEGEEREARKVEKEKEPEKGEKGKKAEEEGEKKKKKARRIKKEKAGEEDEKA